MTYNCSLSSDYGYSALNGVYGTNSYLTSPMYSSAFTGGYYGIFSDADEASEYYSNQYEISGIQQSYSNSSGLEATNWQQLANNVANLMQSGRTDDVSAEYQKLVDAIGASDQYQYATEQEIQSAASNYYQNATGLEINTQIDEYANSSFMTGVLQGVPIIGTFFAQDNSAEDLKAEMTGIPVSNTEVAKKATGAAASGFASGFAIGTACSGLNPVVGVVVGTVCAGVGLFKSLAS